jgi:signal transduction histidine kinase
MGDFVRSVAEFCRPIPDRELPRLRQQSLRSAKVLCVLTALLGPGGLVSLPAEFLLNDAFERSLGVTAFTVFAAGLGYLLSRSRWAAKHVQLLFLLLISIPLVSGALLGWSNPKNLATLPVLMVIPLIILVYYPLRPTVAALVQLPVLGAIATAHALSPSGLAALPDAYFVLALVMAFGGATTSQVMRLRLEEIERMKDQLIATERMTTLGAMSARLAHELKTPIAAMLNVADGLRSLAGELQVSIGDPRVTEQDLREIAAEIAELVGCGDGSAKRAASFIQAIRTHTAGAVRHEEQTFSIRDRIDAVLQLLSCRLRQSSVVVDVADVCVDVRVVGAPEKFDQIATNLLCNALDACEESGMGTLVRVEATLEGAHVRFVVEDDGPGVPEALRDRVFEALVTSREQGTGLGLSIARDIAGVCFSGTLELQGRSRFVFRFPADRARETQEPAKETKLFEPRSDGRGWLDWMRVRASSSAP